MTSRSRMRGLCAELGEEDGLDLHAVARPAARQSRKPGPALPGPGLDRKVWQLCHQVAETLEEVLAECGDTVLQGLRVMEVEPAPDSSRMLVTVAVEDEGPSGTDLDLRRVHEHLARAAGHLRSEVATAITRKRTPVLIYRIAAASSLMEAP